VHRDAGDLAGREQPGYDVGVVAQHLRLDVGRDAAHRVVRGRLDRDRVGVGLDAEVGAHELGDVGQLLVQLLPRQVGQVEYDVVGVRPAAAALADLLPDRAGDHVARSEVLDGRRVALHEALAVLVAEDAALASRALGQQDAELVDAGRVELEELHVLEREPVPVDDRRRVTGQRVRVGRDLEHLAEAAAGEDHRLGLEDVDLAGRQLVGDDAGVRPSLRIRSRT
jgi:hypothetical protein